MFGPDDSFTQFSFSIWLMNVDHLDRARINQDGLDSVPQCWSLSHLGPALPRSSAPTGILINSSTYYWDIFHITKKQRLRSRTLCAYRLLGARLKLLGHNKSCLASSDRCAMPWVGQEESVWHDRGTGSALAAVYVRNFMLATTWHSILIKSHHQSRPWGQLFKGRPGSMGARWLTLHSRG